jgi:hypothetical protein
MDRAAASEAPQSIINTELNGTTNNNNSNNNMSKDYRFKSKDELAEWLKIRGLRTMSPWRRRNCLCTSSTNLYAAYGIGSNDLKECGLAI